jgi:hypothetical protein
MRTAADGRLQASHSVGLIYVFPHGPQLKAGHREHDASQVKGTSAFYSCIPTGMPGPTCIFWTNLTPFPLQKHQRSPRLSAEEVMQRAGSNTPCPLPPAAPESLTAVPQDTRERLTRLRPPPQIRDTFANRMGWTDQETVRARNLGAVPFAFPDSTSVLCGAFVWAVGRLTAQNGGFWPGQVALVGGGHTLGRAHGNCAVGTGSQMSHEAIFLQPALFCMDHP